MNGKRTKEMNLKYFLIPFITILAPLCEWWKVVNTLFLSSVLESTLVLHGVNVSCHSIPFAGAFRACIMFV